MSRTLLFIITVMALCCLTYGILEISHPVNCINSMVVEDVSTGTGDDKRRAPMCFKRAMTPKSNTKESVLQGLWFHSHGLEKFFYLIDESELRPLQVVLTDKPKVRFSSEMIEIPQTRAGVDLFVRGVIQVWVDKRLEPLKSEPMISSAVSHFLYHLYKGDVFETWDREEGLNAGVCSLGDIPLLFYNYCWNDGENTAINAANVWALEVPLGQLMLVNFYRDSIWRRWSHLRGWLAALQKIDGLKTYQRGPIDRQEQMNIFNHVINTLNHGEFGRQLVGLYIERQFQENKTAMSLTPTELVKDHGLHGRN